MVRARGEFLGLGHYAPIATDLADAAATIVGDRRAGAAAGSAGCVADLGAGTGYYLAGVLARLAAHAGLALDISKYAMHAAAGAHPRIGAVRCDAWRRLPVAEEVADLVLNVFAPRDGAELRRILRPSGSLLVVTPGPEHLSDLIGQRLARRTGRAGRLPRAVARSGRSHACGGGVAASAAALSAAAVRRTNLTASAPGARSGARACC